MPVYHVTIGDKEYEVEVPNPRERPVRAIVEGETIEVEIASATAPAPAAVPAPAVVGQPAPTVQPVASAAGSGAIAAPLPGVVISIAVEVGDVVERGQELCILEAMKMKNPIRATANGTVGAVHISVGQQVQHGAPLFTLES